MELTETNQCRITELIWGWIGGVQQESLESFRLLRPLPRGRPFSRTLTPTTSPLTFRLSPPLQVFRSGSMRRGVYDRVSVQVGERKGRGSIVGHLEKLKQSQLKKCD